MEHIVCYQVKWLVYNPKIHTGGEYYFIDYLYHNPESFPVVEIIAAWKNKATNNL